MGVQIPNLTSGDRENGSTIFWHFYNDIRPDHSWNHLFNIIFFLPYITVLFFFFFKNCLSLYFELGVSAHILKSYLKLTVSNFCKSHVFKMTLKIGL